MIITGIGNDWAPAQNNTGTGQEDNLLAINTRQDVVSFSQTARDLASGQLSSAHPAAMLSNEQVQVKMSLLQSFMDILFGRREEAETTPEQEMAAAVLDKPATEESLQVLQQNGWIA
ncbi:MAG: hypothetical protein HQM06_15045 [Magnetococcales bacterium]|nr:hypothetical protein [Magnetococcales bacterium]